MRKPYTKYIRRELTDELLDLMCEIWKGQAPTLYLIHKYKVSKHIVYKLRHEMGLRKPQFSRINKGYSAF